jgi:hypothetical protein
MAEGPESAQFRRPRPRSARYRSSVSAVRHRPKRKLVEDRRGAQLTVARAARLAVQINPVLLGYNSLAAEGRIWRTRSVRVRFLERRRKPSRP